MKKNSVVAGVFCDVQGTLLDYKGERVNKDILEMLEKYEKQGKQIFLWTGGDPDDFREMIVGLGIEWSILKKYDFRNKIVEIAIDDIPEKKFIADYKIKAQTFVFYDTGIWS